MSHTPTPGPGDAYIFGDRLPVGEAFEDSSDQAWDLWMRAVDALESCAAFPPAPQASAYDPPDRSLRGATPHQVLPFPTKRSLP